MQFSLSLVFQYFYRCYDLRVPWSNCSHQWDTNYTTRFRFKTYASAKDLMLSLVKLTQKKVELAITNFGMSSRISKHCWEGFHQAHKALYIKSKKVCSPYSY